MGIILCSLEPKDWLNVVLAIIGILVSGVGLLIAIRQIMRIKSTSEKVHQEVKKSQKQIRQTLDSNEIGRAVKNLEQAIELINKKEIDRALARMIDVKSVVENDKRISQFLSDDLQTSYHNNAARFQESLKTVMNDLNFVDSIDKRMVISSLMDMYDSLVKIENAIKNSVYES